MIDKLFEKDVNARHSTNNGNQQMKTYDLNIVFQKFNAQFM